MWSSVICHSFQEYVSKKRLHARYFYDPIFLLSYMSMARYFYYGGKMWDCIFVKYLHDGIMYGKTWLGYVACLNELLRCAIYMYANHMLP